MIEKASSISDALEQLALALGESGAVPVGELARALERSTERLRSRAEPMEMPSDLVTQAEASRRVGVSRQAVNQWVRKGTLRTYTATDQSGRRGPQVSLSDVAIAASRRPPAMFSPNRRREFLAFLELIDAPSTDAIASEIRAIVEEDSPSCEYSDESRVLREFVIAAMDTGERQREFTAEGVRLLAELSPKFDVDRSSPFGRLADSLGLLVTSSRGVAGFDSPVTTVLGLLGMATVGTHFPGNGADAARGIAEAAETVWGEDFPERLYDVAFHMGGLAPSPLARYTASLTYLDNNRFLRQAQSAGVSVAYSRGPGPILPQRFYGAPIHHDLLRGRRRSSRPWAFTPEAATAIGPPAENPSAVNPFRVFNYAYGLLDDSIHGIRRYCFSAPDARDEFRKTLGSLTVSERGNYVKSAVETLAHAISMPHVELVAIETQADFDWWKDHIIRASEREILIGLRDENARKVAHAILVQTSMLPDVVNAADNDSSLRNRLRIYVKNLEFEVVDARYQDDLRRGVTRVVKAGGSTLSRDESLELAEAEIRQYML